MALGRNTSACVAPDSAGEKPLAFTGDKGLIHHNAICNASWLRPDQFIGIGIFANACPDTTSPVIETARLRIGHPQASKRVKPQIRVIDTAFRIRVFHDCGAGTEGSAIIIADTQHHNVAAYLCVLTAVKVDKNASGRADFNGGNPLPAAVCVLKAFLRCVSCCKIPPFVATMGTQYLAQGIGYIVSRVQTMRYPVVTSPDGWFKRVFYKSLDGFPMGVIYMVILFVIASFMFRYTKIGKYACAIGSNCEATRLSGVDTRRWTMLVYIIAGVFAGLAGIFYSATYTSVLPGSGSGMEMNAIAAVVIGGTSLSGGSGTMLGTIIGVFIMAVLKNGLMTIGIQQQWQVFFTGLAVLLAVMLDIYRSVKLKRS